MNTGVIAHRYALALFKYVQETGEGEVACRQASVMEKCMMEHPELVRIVRDAIVVSHDGIFDVFRAAAGGSLCPSMERFLEVLDANGRLPYIRLILKDFVEMYLRSRNTVKARLISSRPMDADLRDRLVSLVRDKMGEELVLTESVDPSLTGGFIFEIDGYMLDASVRHRLEIIRNELQARNRRIV